MQLILLAPYCQTAEHSLVRGQQWNNTAAKNVESKNVEKPKQNLGDMWNMCDYTCLIVYYSILLVDCLLQPIWLDFANNYNCKIGKH